MKKCAFTLVELLIVLAIFGIFGAFMATSGMSSITELMKTQKIVNELSEAVNGVEYYLRGIYKYIRAFSVRGEGDEIKVRKYSISGKVYVSGVGYEAVMEATGTNEATGLIWKVEDEEIIMPPLKGIDIKFQEAPQDVIDQYGFGVYLILKRTVYIENTKKEYLQKVFLPFVNVR